MKRGLFCIILALFATAATAAPPRLPVPQRALRDTSHACCSIRRFSRTLVERAPASRQARMRC